MTRTGQLEGTLHRLRGRMTRLVWTHGLATVVGATAALLLLDFLLDWTLHVPRGIRLFHLFCLGALPAYLILRCLAQPLASRPDRTRCAVLLERAHPEHRELLVTAAELRSGRRAASDPELAERILEEAETAAAGLDLSRVLDARGPRLRLLLGSLSTALCAAILLYQPDAARVFFVRLFGGNAAWPVRTHLAIELPSAGTVPSAPGEAPAVAGGDLEVRVARGSDVPVVVRAEGATPEEVTLHFSGGQRTVIAASGGGSFRTLLRSVQEDVEMYATGGDDVDQDPRVRLVVLRPPDVAGLKVDVEPPAYSGLQSATHEGGDVDVLAGSRVVVHVLPDPPDATGQARLLPDDRVVDLVPSPFPGPVGQGAPPDSPGLSFTLSPEKTLRYRIELTDATRLSNPDPGLFAITVVDDRPPEVEILSPGRGDYDTVQGGSLALRARARDDYGITRMTLAAVPAGAAQGGGTIARDLAFSLVPREEIADAGPGPTSPDEPPSAERPGRPGSPSLRSIARAVARTRTRIEVAEIADPGGAAAGSQIELCVTAADNRQPTAHEGRSAVLRVRVVAPDEYLRRLQDRLGRARNAAAAVSELQRGKLRRTDELVAGLESDALLSSESGDEIFAAATGERRVEGDARALARELCSALEGVLYARVDDRAGPLLEKIDAALAASDRTFEPEIWRSASAEERAASGKPAGLADRLLAIAGLALEVSEVEAPAATAALARAQSAGDLTRVHAELSSASASQRAVIAKLENLLEMLAEWDNYQSVLSLTHDILNGQKTLEERTKTFAKEH